MRSRRTSSNFSPARYVRSSTAPLTTFFSLRRTKAPPFPGLTCWYSCTEKSCLSIRRTMPGFISVELIIVSGTPSKNRVERAKREKITLLAESENLSRHEVLDDRSVAKFLACVHVREVHFDDGKLASWEVIEPLFKEREPCIYNCFPSTTFNALDERHHDLGHTHHHGHGDDC